MAERRQTGPRQPSAIPGAAIALTAAVLAVLCAVEGALLLAEAGLFGPRPWRFLALSHGAFWNGLLGDWRTNYPGQPAAMFVTYAALHADLSHLAGNALTIGYLGPVLAGRIGTGATALAFALAIPCGAAAFALLSDDLSPMVGASGAVFGLAGAWLRADLAEHRASGRGGRTVAIWAGWLALLNAAMWWLLGGALAWQTHAGGFVAGWIVCDIALRRR